MTEIVLSHDRREQNFCSRSCRKRSAEFVSGRISDIDQAFQLRRSANSFAAVHAHSACRRFGFYDDERHSKNLKCAKIAVITTRHREDFMRQPLVAWLAAGLVAVSSAAFGQTAFDGHVKVGVLNDQSSLYADATGQGSVVAAQMAAQDYMEANPNSKLKIEITFADHQNKPDIGANIARQ